MIAALLCCPHCHGRLRIELSTASGARKRCQRCREHKPLEAYGKRKSAPDGLSYICRVCDALRAKDQRTRRILKETRNAAE